MIAKNLKEELLLLAASHRHGIVLKPQTARTGLADLRGIWHVGIPQNTERPWQSAAGGVGRDEASARTAAVAEGLERYSASVCELPLRPRTEIADSQRLDAEQFSLFSTAQVASSNFPFANLYAADGRYTNAYSLHDNREVWLPHGLVSLRDDFQTGLSTSSGLAAGPSAMWALLRATQELIERDALMITWLHSLPARQVALPPLYTDEVTAKGGEVTVLDITPAYSPHPVAAVAGCLPLRGHRRYSLGTACRETWAEALEKAYLEWCQGIFFTGYYYSCQPGLRFKRYEDVNSFDDHAVYYTVHPEQWPHLPLFQGESYRPRHRETSSRQPQTALSKLLRTVRRYGLHLYYRDLTTPDLRQLGLHCVRVVSPELTPIFCHQRWPYLGGRTADVLWRYPWAKGLRLNFPNPLPHPLG